MRVAALTFALLACLALGGCASSSDPAPTMVDYNELETRITDLEGHVDGLDSQLTEVCDAIDTAYSGANSATENLLFELQLACP